MRITVVGTGYVGLVTGTCFSELGDDVICVDIDRAKIEALRSGAIPIYEPGLAHMVERNVRIGRLHFTTDLAGAVERAQFVYLAVGTPSGPDGAADLSAFWAATEGMTPHLARGSVVVIKSTVPVGTNAALAARLREPTGRAWDVASNPEFLREGNAVDDFMRPDRVVVGVRRAEVGAQLRELYAPVLDDRRPFLTMSPESAELTKYVANAMLATKISFINEMANLCERAGGNIDDVRQGIGYDCRIGFSFLAPGVGYGGSCFPKDVRALAHTAGKLGMDPMILSAVDQVNTRQKSILAAKIASHFGGQLAGKTIALWGLAFKPETDDIREAPALVLIERLLAAGARLHVHDPEAMAGVRQRYGDRLAFAAQPMQAVENAEALAINTEWREYRHPDFAEIKRRMARPAVFDGRNLYDPAQMAQLGFIYYSIGRASRRQEPEQQRRQPRHVA